MKYGLFASSVNYEVPPMSNPLVMVTDATGTQMQVRSVHHERDASNPLDEGTLWIFVEET